MEREATYSTLHIKGFGGKCTLPYLLSGWQSLDTA
jgi:hypothetical protein